MNYSDIVSKISPCGLDCSRCVSCSFGGPNRLATELSNCLEGFAARARDFASKESVLKEWDNFEAVLGYLKKGICNGCRNPGAACNGSCRVKDCIAVKKVDFCFQCQEYPCENHGLFPPLELRWRANQDAMKSRGLETWFLEQSRKPRY
jgi:hypothetical protein